MKFFSSFGSCCGGTTVRPVADTTAARPQQEPVPQRCGGNGHAPRPTTRGRLKKVHSTTHWKPALPVISEDSLTSDIHRNIERTARSEKKLSLKAKSTAKVRSLIHGDHYRKSCQPMALPAFSPAPFLF